MKQFIALYLTPPYGWHNIKARLRWHRDVFFLRLGWLSPQEFNRRCGGCDE